MSLNPITLEFIAKGNKIIATPFTRARYGITEPIFLEKSDFAKDAFAKAIKTKIINTLFDTVPTSKISVDVTKRGFFGLGGPKSFSVTLYS